MQLKFPGRKTSSLYTHRHMHMCIHSPPPSSITEFLIVWVLSPIQTVHGGPDQYCVLSGALKSVYCRMD